MSPTHVAVTGVSGFIGTQIAHDLLERGYVVHALLRSKTAERVAHLNVLPNADANLHIFEVDVTSVPSILPALQNVTYAIHVASPVLMESKNAQQDIVDPAVNMTTAFLQACDESNIEKVVLTSSIAALCDAGTNGAVVDESCWNQLSSLTRMPYYYSKTLAEQAAWDFIKDKHMKLVVINPGFVHGPALSSTLSVSNKVCCDIANGEFSGIVDLQLPVVDVRDVSEAHIRAMEKESASGRYICCGENNLVHIRDYTNAAISCGLKPPTTDLTGAIWNSVVKLTSYILPGGVAGQFVRLHMSNAMIFDSSKIRNELDMSFRDAIETCKVTYKDLLKRGHLKLESS